MTTTPEVFWNAYTNFYQSSVMPVS